QRERVGAATHQAAAAATTAAAASAAATDPADIDLLAGHQLADVCGGELLRGGARPGELGRLGDAAIGCRFEQFAADERNADAHIVLLVIHVAEMDADVVA